MHPRARRRRSAAGAVLIEALVAAAIVGIALLFLVGLLAHEARLTARAAGQHDAYMLLEAALEGIRAGAVPLVEGKTHYEDPVPPWLPIPVRRGAVLWIEVTPVGNPPVKNLWQVTATVRYRAGRDILFRSVTTRTWQP
jgi:Tfp pilus assembly protein PilV